MKIAKEYGVLFVILINISNLPQIIQMLSLLCNRDEDITIIEKVLELIYCNYQPIGVISNDKDKMRMVDQCLELLYFVKKKYYENNLDLIEAIIIRLIFEQGSITRFINQKSDDNIMNSTIDKTDPACLSNRDNEKTVLSNFSCSTSVLKSLLMEFYDSTSNKLKVRKIKDQSLEHESLTCKIFFVKPFKLETKDSLVLLIKYIVSIPSSNQRLFEYGSMFLINILLQLVNLFNVTSGKNPLIKCSFDHIFQSYQICYSLFYSCFRRADTNNEFAQCVKQNLKSITQTLIHWHPKPFIYKLYNQLISISKEDKCDYLEHFNFNIDIKHNDINILCYENNIKEYTSMMRNLVDYKSLPINFKSEFMTFIQAIKSNGKIYLPEKIQYAKEAKKMTLLEIIIEILYQLSNKDSDLISEFIWETKECLHTIVYTFDIKNVNTTKGKHQPDVENKCLTSVIYSKYQDNDSLIGITDPKILQKLEKEIKELKLMKDFKKEIVNQKPKPENKISKTLASIPINDILLTGEIEDNSFLLNEFELLDVKKKSSFNECSNCQNFKCYCVESNIIEKPNNSIKKQSKNNVTTCSVAKIDHDDDNELITGFYDISIPDVVLCCKRDILLRTFSLHFLNIYFDDDQFNKVKRLYSSEILSNYPKNKSIYSHSVELSYPTKHKNYSSCKLFNPRIFLKKDLNFYTNPLFPISHRYYEPEKAKNEIKTYNTLIANISQDPFDLPYFKKASRLFEHESELIKIEYVTRGRLYLTSNCLLFQSKEKDKNNQMTDRIDYMFKSNDHDLKQRNKEIIMVLNQIEEVLIRRFLFMYQAIEVFMKNGKCYFFNLYRSETILMPEDSTNKGILNHLKELKIKHEYSYRIIDDPKKEVVNLKLVNKWNKNQLPTYDFLLLLNKYSGRSYNDINQYPIMPWIFTNSVSDPPKTQDFKRMNTVTTNSNEKRSIFISNLSLTKNMSMKDNVKCFSIKQTKGTKNRKTMNLIAHLLNSNYRDFQYPMSVQLLFMRERTIIKYQNQKLLNPSSFLNYFNYFYSTNGFVLFYLFRLNPFSNAQIMFQSMKYDLPSRQFKSFSELIKILYLNFDNRELIPDLYSSFEYCLNMNYNLYSSTSEGKLEEILVNNLEMPDNISNPAQLVYLHHKSLNSDNIKEMIHDWINNIFGYYQFKPNIPTRMNIFNKYCYAANINLNSKKKEYLERSLSKDTIIDKLRFKANLIMSFGQIPEQVLVDELIMWNKSSFNNENKEIDDFTYEWNKNIICKDSINQFGIIIYVNLTSQKRYVYTLIKICNEFNPYFELKIFKKLVDISKPVKVSIDKMKLFKIKYDDKFLLRYQPKYSIFDTHDGEYFFTCRHYDNSIKIYNKDGEISSYLTDSFILSISRISDDEFLSGSRDGKLVHWNIIYITIGKESTVKIEKKREIFAHHQMISSINYIKKHNIIITTGDDHLLLIRKYHTFELLTKISTNNDLEFFTDCVFSNYNLIYTMTLDTNLLRKPKNKWFFITGYSLNGISFSKTKPDKFNGLYVNDNGILIAGIYDPPSIGLFSLVREKTKYINNSDIQIQFEKVSFIEDFNWENKLTTDKLFSNFTYFEEDNTFYVVLSRKFGRFSYDQISSKDTLFT